MNRNQHHNASTSWGFYLVNRQVEGRMGGLRSPDFGNHYMPFLYRNDLGSQATNHAGAYRCNEKQL